MLQVAETLSEYAFDEFYDEVVKHELLAIGMECLTEEWADGGWAAVSVMSGVT